MFARDRDFGFPRLGFGSRMLGFRDPFEDFFTEPMMVDDPWTRLGSLWTDFGTLTPDADLQYIAPVQPQQSLTSGAGQQQQQQQQQQPQQQEKMDVDAGAESGSHKGALLSRNEGQASSLVRPSGSDWLQSYIRAPHVEVIPRDKEFIVKADLPGVRKEDVKVNITEDARGRKMLNISGERKEEETSKPDENSSYTSRRYGKFSRSLLLPDGCVVDGIKAKQENGVLNIVVPRKPVEPKKTNAVDVNIE